MKYSFVQHSEGFKKDGSNKLCKLKRKGFLKGRSYLVIGKS